MNNKIKIGIIAVCLLLVTGVTFMITRAYLISNSAISNIITIADNTIEIEERVEQPKTLIPGSVITKEVAFNNTGNTTAYIRARLLFSNSDAQEFCKDLVIGSDWVLKSDGYYYYTKKVAIGDKTSNIINKIEIKDTVSESDLIDFELLVYAESVNGNKFSTYQSAWNVA